MKAIRLLVLTDLYPTSHRPNEGVFVWRMARSMEATGVVQTRVIALRRIFPEWHLLRSLFGGDWRKPRRYWRHWRTQEPLASSELNSVEFGRICYTSLPRVGGQATWGRAAYTFGGRILRGLHRNVEFDLVHAHFAIASGNVAQLLAEDGGPPFVVSVHGYEVAFTAERCPGGRDVLRRVLRAARAVVVNSSRTREKVLALGGIDPALVRVIHQGGDLPVGRRNRWEVKKDWPSVFSILTVGGLARQKGQEVVLQAAAQLSAEGVLVRCVLVGEGNDGPRLRALAKRLGIADRVVFAGPIPPDEIGDYYEECDAFVLPSWNEAFGVAYVEAMHYGKPLVGVTGEGGPEDLAAFGAGIVRIARGDYEALASVLKRWIQRPEEADELGERNLELARREFTWARHAERLLRLYAEILGCDLPQNVTSAPRQDPNGRIDPAFHGNRSPGAGIRT